MQELALIKLVGELAESIGADELASELENLRRAQNGPSKQRVRRESDGRLRGAPILREGPSGPELHVRKSINGKRIPFYAETPEELEKKIQQFGGGDVSAAGKNDHSRRTPNTAPETLFEGFDRFLAQYAQSERAEGALHDAIRRVLIRPVPEDTRGRVLGDLSPFETDAEELQLIVNKMAANGNPRRLGGGYALNTVNNSVKGVRQFSNYGEATWEWPNIGKGLVTPKKGLSKASYKDVHPYRSWEEVYALANALEELRHPELSRLCRWTCGTGERLQESLVKRECDLMRANGEVRVHRAIVNGTEIEMTKYDSAAVYYLTDVAREVSDEIPADLRRDPFEWRDSPLLFPWHEDGGIIDIHAVRRRDPRGKNDGLWHQAHRLAGLAYRPPKQMRHTFAYLALTGGGENGNPELRWALEDVSTQLRHSSTAITEEYYLDLVPQMLRRSREQMAIGAHPFHVLRAAS